MLRKTLETNNATYCAKTLSGCFGQVVAASANNNNSQDKTFQQKQKKKYHKASKDIQRLLIRTVSENA